MILEVNRALAFSTAQGIDPLPGLEHYLKIVENPPQSVELDQVQLIEFPMPGEDYADWKSASIRTEQIRESAYIPLGMEHLLTLLKSGMEIPLRWKASRTWRGDISLPIRFENDVYKSYRVSGKLVPYLYFDFGIGKWQSDMTAFTYVPGPIPGSKPKVNEKILTAVVPKSIS